MQVIKIELCCDIWLNFGLVTVQSCAVCNETAQRFLSLCYRQTQISRHLPIAASVQILAPTLHPFKPKVGHTDQSVELQRSSEQSLRDLFIFGNFNIAQVDREILEKRYITMINPGTDYSVGKLEKNFYMD